MRRQQRHDRLLRAAADVFAKQGFAHASLSDIVAQAGVSRQTFYEHFDDMQECLMQVYDFAIRNTFRDVEPLLKRIEDPVERLKAGIQGYLTIIGRNASLALVLNREILGVGRRYAARREAAYNRWSTLIMEGVDEARERGQLTRRPDELTAFALVGAMETTALRYIDRGEEDRIQEAAPILIELVLRAFR